MISLIILVVVVSCIYLYTKNQKTKNTLEQRDREWVKYIAKYKNIVTSTVEKKLIDSMLADVSSKSILTKEEIELIENQVKQANVTLPSANKAVSVISQEQTKSSQLTKEKDVNILAKNDYADTAISESVSQVSDTESTKPKTVPLDNISLLLFFGAFLFVTSVGLFVTLGNASGWVRTISVLVVTLSLYGIGLWIYRNKPALEIASITFIGISIAIAPLVGVAAYNYISGASPQVIWFMTSVICLGLYAHALFAIRKPLLNYVFIFTLLSTFESGVAIMNVPIYYYGWVMIAVGLLLQAISTWKGVWPDFRDSSKAGSHIYIPLAIMVSLAAVQSQGFGQLGVTLLLGSVFYGLESWRTKLDLSISQLTAVVSHLSLLAGLSCLFYSVDPSLYKVGWLLASLSIGEIIFLLIGSRQSVLFKNIASITIVSTILGLFLMFGHFMAMTIVLGLIIVESLFVWWWQKREDVYAVAMIAWIILPNLLGYFAIHPHLSIISLTVLNIVSLALQSVLFIFIIQSKYSVEQLSTARTTLTTQVLVIALIAFANEPLATLGAVTIISLVLLPLSFLDKNKHSWEIMSGIIVSLGVLRGWNNPVILMAIMVALIFNILLSLRFRSEANRWLSTGLWLLLPIGLGGLTTVNVWSNIIYAWAYMFVMLGLIISRMIARGVVFASGNIPLVAYARTTSQSYLYGYILAGCLSVAISLFSNQSQVHTTLILAVLGLIIAFLAWVVEKDVDLIALLPLLLQVMLISIIRPAKTGNSLVSFILLSSALATGCYVLTFVLKESEKSKYLNINLTEQTSLTASLIAPGSFLYATNSLWAMPISLGVSGGLFLDYWYKATQAKREIAVGIITSAIMWMLYIFGIREVQAYSHILVLMFAGFAWWRSVLGDEKNSDGYIYFALLVATVPLIVQALSTEAGGVYGWWLLLEQVVFMIIGTLIHKRFVVLWGTYVAVGSVLYQLRHLGYAALAVLAIFVIGMAIYKLQRSNKSSEDQKAKENLAKDKVINFEEAVEPVNKISSTNKTNINDVESPTTYLTKKIMLNSTKMYEQDSNKSHDKDTNISSKTDNKSKKLEK